jgi:hypothetical protein
MLKTVQRPRFLQMLKLKAIKLFIGPNGAHLVRIDRLLFPFECLGCPQRHGGEYA